MQPLNKVSASLSIQQSRRSILCLVKYTHNLNVGLGNTVVNTMAAVYQNPRCWLDIWAKCPQLREIKNTPECSIKASEIGRRYFATKVLDTIDANVAQIMARRDADIKLPHEVPEFQL